jgi:hypothetical protein
MFVKKRFIVIAGLAIAVTVASAAATSAGPSREFTNLKVLPKDVSSKDLQHIMIDVFEDGLGVNCGFCHAEQKGSHKLDYASDAKPEKQIARNMMRMTLKLNSKYFQVHRPGLGDPGLVVTCETCHQGKPRPDLAGGQ